MLKAIIFDMDGVLVDSEYTYLKRITTFLQSLEYDIEFLDVCPIAGSDDRTVWNLLGEALHEEFDAHVMKKKLKAYVNEHPIHYPDLLDKGAETILRKLKNDGFQIALASSSHFVHINEMLDSCHLRSYFNHILSGEMFERTKPDPAIYLKTVELLGCSKEECLVIEDSKFGIQAAKGAGLFTLAKKEERYPMDQAMADAYIHTFEEAYEFIKNK